MNNLNSFDDDNFEKDTSKKGIIIAAAICLGLVLLGVILSVNAYNKNVAENNARVITETRSLKEEPIVIPRTTYEIYPFNSKAYEEQAQAGKETTQSYYTSSWESSASSSVTAAETLNVINDDPLSFMAPVAGEVLTSFSDDALVFSNTLSDWRAHIGSDYAGKVGDPVCAVADGTVESFEYDEFYGNVLTVSHKDGYESKYCGLNDIVFFEVGDSLLQGDVIGTISGDIPLESAEDCHLHLEILKDGNYQNPLELIA